MIITRYRTDHRRETTSRHWQLLDLYSLLPAYYKLFCYRLTFVGNENEINKDKRSDAKLLIYET
jgi:hypothetical protein